jgi:DNA polymerase III delta prime subunit
MAFVKASKSQSKLRLAISGPPGSGKTYTALLLAKHLGGKVACIDTERGSASKYAGDVADFDTNELAFFSVAAYLAAIKEAADGAYGVLVVDSMSHAWAGKGGVLEEVDKRGGKFDAWRHATPLQQSLVDAILSYPGHVICTMRSKIAYDVTSTERNGRKETKVEKLGLAPVQRDDLSYEFDVVFEMNDRNMATISKSRCAALAGQVIDKPGADVAAVLKRWLTDGAPVVERVDPVEALLAALKAASTPEALAKATDDASALKPTMTRPQVLLVADAVRVALARIAQLAEDAAEAEEAERALAAQEAAEKGDGPFASATSATGSSASEGDAPLSDTSSTPDTSAAGFTPTASSSAESAQAGAL